MKEVSDCDQGTCIERYWDQALSKAKFPIRTLPIVTLRPTPQIFQGVELRMELGKEVEDITSITALLNSLIIGNQDM
jgi:hypothetical protein